MGAKVPISYKPTMDAEELKNIIVKKLRYVAVNRFIDEAVQEKLEREMGLGQEAKMKKLVSTLEEAVREYKGWTMHKPTKAQIQEIERKSKLIEQGKVKPVKWKGSFK
jgi:hypothetical protein